MYTEQRFNSIGLSIVMAASKIALVTGANTGLGLEIVRALCRSDTQGGGCGRDPEAGVLSKLQFRFSCSTRHL